MFAQTSSKRCKRRIPTDMFGRGIGGDAEPNDLLAHRTLSGDAGILNCAFEQATMRRG